MSVLLRQGLRSIIQTSLGNPASGSRLLYPKSDGWYDRTSAGVERKLEYDIVGAGGGAAVTGFAADTYLAGSGTDTKVAGRLQVGTWFHCRFRVVKTAAGVAAPVIIIRAGTLGTTSDAAVCTLTFAAQTGVIDQGEFDIEGNFNAVGASAVVSGSGRLSHGLATTGLNVTATNSFITAVGSSFDSSLVTRVGVSVNGGTSAAWTISNVQSELRNLA
jgi:hypothetical protein